MSNRPELMIGRTIKELRTQRDLTLEELGEKSGLSKAFLSKVEHDKISPSIPTLWRIAEALGIGMGAFFSGFEGNGQTVPIIVRASDRKEIARGSAEFGYTYEALARGASPNVIEPFIVRFSPTHKATKPLIHAGHEFNYFLKGTVEFYYGDKTFVLREGDSSYYDSSVPHRGVALGSEEAVVLAVLIVDCR